MQPLIEIQRGSKYYRTASQCVRALQAIDLQIDKGEFVAIMGPSGSGKSTLMNIVGCLDVLSHGLYRFDGQNTTAINDNRLSEIRNQKIGFIFQTFNLLPHATARQNVQLPLVYAGVSAGASKRMAEQALRAVGLGDRLAHKPTELSGGQRQRVAIARALVNNPLVLLADEPTGNLDAATSAEIMSIFKTLHECGHTIIVVTHEAEVARYAQRVVFLKDGRLVQQQYPSDGLGAIGWIGGA